MNKKAAVLMTVGICVAFLMSACVSLDGGAAETSPESSDTGSVTSGDVKTTDITVDTTFVNTTASDTSADTVGTSETLGNDEIDSTNLVVQTAEALIGIPFAENSATPVDGFDNSGFIYYVLRENGFINCPRITSEQAEMGENIGYGELNSGDLAFFCTDNSGKPDFGGIYIGGGIMIFSPMPEQSVKKVDITSEYWKSVFVIGVDLS